MNPMFAQPMPMQQPPQMPGEGAGAMGQGQNYISQQSHSDDREVAYENAFKDSAYNVFSTKFPEFVPSIVTFKIIKSSIDDGDAVGAFILQYLGETLYVPIIMSDNNLKPMEILYSKRMDKFVPFNKEWINVIQSTGKQTLGEGVKPTDAMTSDVDMATMIRPPLDGRTVYAMDLSGLDYLEIIRQAANPIKDLYKEALTKDSRHLKFAAENFDVTALRMAITHHKEAPIEKVAGLEIVDSTDSAQRVKELFGPDSKIAMTKIAKEGFAYKDGRKNLNRSYTLDMKIKLEEPTHSGVYYIYMCDGSTKAALVIVNPEKMEPLHEDYPRLHGSPVALTPHPQKHFCVILENGDYFETCHLIATPANKEDFTGAVADMVYGDKKPTTVSKSNVCFVKVDGDVVSGTEARYVDRTESASDGAKRYVKEDALSLKSDNYIYREKGKRGRVEFEILHAKTPSGRILRPSHSCLITVPMSYKIVKLGDKLHDKVHLNRAKDVLDTVQQRMSDDAGKRLKLQNVGSGEYAINHRPVGSYKTACVKLASDYGIAMPTAMKAFAKLKFHGEHVDLIVVPHEKNASIFSSGVDGTQLPPEAIQQMGQPEQPQQQQPTMQDMGMMQQGMAMGDQDVYSLGVLNSLAHNPDIRDLLSVYSPTIEKAMDNCGRMLLTFWLRGQKAKNSLGEELYYTTEESLRSVFKGIGSLLTKINRQVTAMPDEAEL